MDKNINVKVIDRKGKVHDLVIPVDVGLNLMEVCKSCDLPVEGICGGMAMCASCHCYILSEGKIIRKDAEQAMLDDTENVKSNSRLCCQMPITEELDGITIELAPETEDNGELD